MINLNYTDGFAVTPSDTLDVEFDPGNPKGIGAVVLHNVSAGATVRVMPSGQSTPKGFTLTGSSGTANITINGTAYLATFTSTLTTSAANFVTSHSLALNLLGIQVRSAGAKVIFSGAIGGSFAIANVSGDLSGTALADTPITIYIAQGGTSDISVRRVYNTTPAPPANLIAYSVK